MNKALLAVLTLALAAPVQAVIVDGVDVATATPRAPSGTPVIIPPPAGATVINFDETTAPCVFADLAGPLTTAYAAQGVTFSGPNPGSGGGVVNECGGFNISGQSSPNFLAFNTLANYQGGGTVTSPETLVFANPVSYVQANVGHESSLTITLACFNDMTPVGTSSFVGGSALSTISVSGAGINRCTLSYTGQVLVVDDLAFGVNAGAVQREVPTVGQWGIAAMTLLLGLFGLTWMRRTANGSV